MTGGMEGFWELWIGTFAARADAYVKNSSVTVSEPLTPLVCEQAEMLGDSISGFLVTTNDDGKHVTHVAAIDVDTTREDALAIRAHLADSGVKTLLVNSRRGAHLWVWPEMPAPASTVRRALTNAVKVSITDPSQADHIEVFPKEGANGGALRMPLFQHPKDGKVYPAIDPDGCEINHRRDLLIYTAELTTPYNALYALAGGPMPADAYPARLGRQGRSTGLTAGPDDTVSAVLQRQGITNAQPGRSVRCPWHEDRHASLSIFKDDQRAVCKAPTCPAFNGGRGIGSFAMRRLVEGK